ncbi:MAG: hypothetical protein EOM28_00960 [Clostridia bacterium]|nr:hypothetical protein [Clostridia bacterium]
MAYNYDGYLTFGIKIDESGFEKGVSDMKNLANLSAKAVSSSVTGSANKFSLFAASVTKGLEKITEQALGLGDAAKNGINQSTFEVEKSMSRLEKAVASISDTSLQKAKARASSYKELGSLYLKYMKEGLDAQASTAISSMEWQIDSNVEAFTAANKKAAPAYRKAAKELMAVYKEALKNGTDEAYKLVAARIEDITEEAQKQYDEIIEQRDRMQEKLSDFGELFARDDDGDIQLENIDKQTEALERYEKVLERLQEKGVSDGLLNEIIDMGVVDGTDFAEELLSKSDATFERYNEAWTLKQEAAKTIAEKFYADELETLDKNFTEELDAALANIPEECANVGVNAVNGIITGMESQRGDAVATAKSIADAIIAELKRTTETASPSKRAAREVGKPLTQGIIKGMKDAYDPQEMESYADRMITDIGRAQSEAAQSVLQKNTSSIWNSSVYNGGDFVLKIEKMVNDGKGSVASLLQEAEFYRKQKVSATGGA